MPTVTYPPPWEDGPNAVGPGGVIIPVAGPGVVGTIGVGTLGSQGIPPVAPLVQAWLGQDSYLGADGNVYAYNRATGIAWKIS